MTHLTLSAKGLAKVRAKATELAQIPPDFRLIAQLTGFPVASVKQALSTKKWRTKPKPPAEALGPVIPENNMPTFAWEIHQATGLQVNFYRNLGDGVSEWVVVSPTNMALMLIWGRDDVCQGVQVIAAHKLQGISTTQVQARMAAKPPRAEPALDVLIEESGETDDLD